jgi:hypothetical protein
LSNSTIAPPLLPSLTFGCRPPAPAPAQPIHFFFPMIWVCLVKFPVTFLVKGGRPPDCSPASLFRPVRPVGLLHVRRPMHNPPTLHNRNAVGQHLTRKLGRGQ